MFKRFLAIGIFALIVLAEALATPSTCPETGSNIFNASQMSGVWWEVARSPDLTNRACVQVNITLSQTENVMEIATTYSISTTYLWINQTMYANVSLANVKDNSFNISYVNGNTTTPSTVYKLLNTDYKSYALFYGYTDASNNETSFGFVLTRERFPNITQLIGIEDAASALYADYTFGHMPLVTQTPRCHGAATAVQYPVFALVLVVLFTALNRVI